MFTRVCKADTLAEGGFRLVIADSHLVLLVWPEDAQDLRAFQGVCPHAATPLAEADFDGRVLTCPIHGWTWDLATGEAVEPQVSPLAAYPVKVEDGVVYVDTEGVAPLFAPP